MELDMHTIGLRIKNRRKELRLTQIDIKSAVGISSGNISDIENGNRLPAASTLVQLAKILDCSVDWILTGTSSNKENSALLQAGDYTEEKLLANFRKLAEKDKEEIQELIEFKLHRAEKEKDHTKSSDLTDPEKNNIAG